VAAAGGPRRRQAARTAPVASSGQQTEALRLHAAKAPPIVKDHLCFFKATAR
jgi:hypothetical protein